MSTPVMPAKGKGLVQEINGTKYYTGNWEVDAEKPDGKTVSILSLYELLENGTGGEPIGFYSFRSGSIVYDDEEVVEDELDSEVRFQYEMVKGEVKEAGKAIKEAVKEAKKTKREAEKAKREAEKRKKEEKEQKAFEAEVQRRVELELYERRVRAEVERRLKALDDAEEKKRLEQEEKARRKAEEERLAAEEEVWMKMVDAQKEERMMMKEEDKFSKSVRIFEELKGLA